MPDYQKMYYILCDAVSKALDLMPTSPNAAVQILRLALDHAEDIYVETAPDGDADEK